MTENENENENTTEPLVDPFDHLGSMSEPSAPVLPKGEKAARKHCIYHLGKIQGDSLGDDFEQQINPAKYGLSKFHASLIAGKNKLQIVAEVENAIKALFPREPTSKTKMAAHRYIRIGAILLAAQKGGHTEESAIQALLE